ncbi:MAG: efflux RND transporter permease subunit [Armatimonadetes bacterium]|nr:efflux RND transporter permease subunit [Armatimonadota bacterium]
MLNRVIQESLKHRVIIIAFAALTILYGIYTVPQMNVDVLPDLNRPVVTIMTEAHGLAPEETETLVSFPIEAMMNGATGVHRVRSSSSAGFSIVFVEFDWDMEIYRARQIVSEKLQLVQARLPVGSIASLAPISSIMGEIMLIALSSKSGDTAPTEVRALADFVVRPRLLGVPGVSQVVAIGGGTRQFQILTNPSRLKQHGITLTELTDAASKSNVSAGGGFLLEAQREEIIRIKGRINNIKDIEQTVIKAVNGVPITIGQVAEVKFDKGLQRGDASVNGDPAVILSVQKQPEANTLKLTREVDVALREIEASLPDDIQVNRDLFRQERFISLSIENVSKALLEATVIVLIVILAFLMNVRATLISIVSIPMSFVLTLLLLARMGIAINTMTLGGLAIAIGLVVDDSIVDVENVFRRLRQNSVSNSPKPILDVIFRASAEVRNSIVYATLIVVLVFVPLLSLEGIEGRVFAPLAIAFTCSMAASLLVSLTLTPALCAIAQKQSSAAEARETRLVRLLKRLNAPLVLGAMGRPWLVMAVVAMLTGLAILAVVNLGREFLPKFNEGSLSISVILPPGSSLEESNRIGTIIERAALTVPEVTYIGRRTGRAEMDEHAEGVNHSELDVGLADSPRGSALAIEELRSKIGGIPGVYTSFGQPISHRLDHLSSGVRAALAIKIFGPDLDILRGIANQVNGVMQGVEGIVDLQIEPQVEVPQASIEIDRPAAARYGISPYDLAESLEIGFAGQKASQVLLGQQTFDMVVWFTPEARGDLDQIRSILISAPTGRPIPLGEIAKVSRNTGPNTINRENVSRRIVIQANVEGRDLGGIVGELRGKVREIQSSWPRGYYVEYGGQFQSQESAMRRILVLGAFTIVGIFLALLVALKSWRMALQVMVNLPLALIGGVVSVYLTDGMLSVASMVGFITLFGIATRNGIMMLSHYSYLMQEEGAPFSKETILRGTQERLVPVLMTALAASLGLLPLALSHGEPGKELLHPIAITILGGLVSSTLLDQMVTPALFWVFGKKEWAARAEQIDRSAD